MFDVFQWIKLFDIKKYVVRVCNVLYRRVRVLQTFAMMQIGDMNAVHNDRVIRDIIKSRIFPIVNHFTVEDSRFVYAVFVVAIQQKYVIASIQKKAIRLSLVSQTNE